jgi:hypothetical protein
MRRIESRKGRKAWDKERTVAKYEWNGPLGNYMQLGWRCWNWDPVIVIRYKGMDWIQLAKTNGSKSWLTNINSEGFLTRLIIITDHGVSCCTACPSGCVTILLSYLHSYILLSVSDKYSSQWSKTDVSVQVQTVFIFQFIFLQHEYSGNNTAHDTLKRIKPSRFNLISCLINHVILK